MNTIKILVARWRHFVRWAGLVLLPAILWLAPAAVAFAKKAKTEVAPAETKSYVFSYFIVIVVVAMGMMSVCRPSGRLDKPDDKFKDKEEE
jgi:hypothetical protein